MLLTPVDAVQGRYRVALPNHIDALYATDGAAPESYTVTMDAVPSLLLRAQGDSRVCSDLPGMGTCAPVTADAPLISYALQLPASITLHMALGGETRDVKFAAPAFNVPLFLPIPAEIDGPLGLAIGVLREALVFKS